MLLCFPEMEIIAHYNIAKIILTGSTALLYQIMTLCLSSHLCTILQCSMVDESDTSYSVFGTYRVLLS